MKKISCPLCDEKYTKLDGLYSHIEDEHSDTIPEGYTAQRYVYYIKTGKTHGSCVMCKKDTEWNVTTGKYKRFCNNPKCKEKYREMFKERMVGKYGKTTLLNDPEQQRKMLAHRHISGEYVWSDGTKKTYTGSYELDFLKMLDAFMEFDSDDVMTPSPHTYYYTYEGEKKFYIPDVFIPSLNLEIEIKDGGDNPNMHDKIVKVDKVKEKLKDEVMASQKDYDYIKIVNKNYDPLFKYLLDRKAKVANAENVDFGTIIKEANSTIDVDLDKKDICANIDDWISGKHKVLLITGYCGSGKSTLTDKLTRKYNARFISLDMFELYVWTEGKVDDPYAHDEYIVDFVKTHNIIEKTRANPDDNLFEYIDKFVQYCIARANAKNERIIIEGYQIFYFTNPKRYVGLPIIILGTSYNKSAIRKIIRSVKSEDILIRKLRIFKSEIIEAIKFKDPDTKQMAELKNTLGLTEGWFDAKAACANAPIEESDEINTLLNSAQRYHNNGIWLATDWHLWKYDKKTSSIYKNKNFDTTIEMYKKMVKDGDVVIYLGDLVDDEFQDKEELRTLIQSLPGTKILVKGNNDLFDDDFYRSCGFVYVCYKFAWNDILFSHMPVENDYNLNCHGHIHGGMMYWIKYTNQVDVYTDDGSPIPLEWAILGQKDYAKEVKVVIADEAEKTRLNTNGQYIPEECPECGCRVNIRFKGDPTWVCSNKSCAKCFGFVPCSTVEGMALNEHAIECLPESYAPVEENLIISEPDLKINLDKWAPGTPLWITGTSGDGKSTLARTLAEKHDALIVPTDILLLRVFHTKEKWDRIVNSKNEFTEERTRMAMEFCKMHPEYPHGLKSKYNATIASYVPGGEKYWNDFFTWVIDAVKHDSRYKNKLIIIEGCDVANYDPQYLATQPLIIIGGSKCKTSLRRIKRDISENHNIVDAMFREIKRRRDFANDLDDVRDEFRKAITTIGESYEPVMEVSNKIRDLDQYFDFERFVNGDTNRLFITGLAGSSKQEMGRELASLFNAQLISLDLFTKTTINMMISGEYYGSAPREYVDMIIDFAHKNIMIDPSDVTKVSQPTDDNIVDFINALIKSLDPRKKYIIEGVYIYRYHERLNNIISKEALVVTHDSFNNTLKKYGMSSMSVFFNIIYDETNNPKKWYEKEKNKLNAFADMIIKHRSDTNNMRYKDDVYPVYVVLLHSGQMLANIIKKWTGDEFSHACISFDPSLRNMMSFGRQYGSDVFQIGMTNESIMNAVYKKPIPFALYVTFVDVKHYKAMKKTAYQIQSRSRELKYNFTGLIKYALGLSAETANALFCSEFVATVLNADGHDFTDGLKAAEVRPESYKYMSKFQLVQRGVLTEYDMDETIRRVAKMKKR